MKPNGQLSIPSRPKLRRIPIARPLVMLLGLLLSGSVIAIAFLTDFRRPMLIDSVIVIFFIVAINVWDRKRQ
jgi:hypothetical protein